MKKYSRQISIDTLKLLLARSGNQCAYVGCTHPIFDDDHIFVAQLCHIEAVSPNGQRYNPNKTNEEVNSYDNLLFLCYRHHKVTDNVTLFTVEKLKKIKYNHESRFKESAYNYSHEVLVNLEKEIENYWLQIDRIQRYEHIAPDLSVPININNDIVSLINEVSKHLEELAEFNAYFMKDCPQEYFEYICLATPNFLTRISMLIDQIHIKYLEEQLLSLPNDKKLKEKLDEIRKKFEYSAKYAALE